MQAADGLLMLQELAQFDNPDTEEDTNSQLMPIGTDLSEANLEHTVHNTNDPVATRSQTPTDNTSEETVIYDSSEFTITAETVPETNLPVPSPSKKKDLEKEEQSLTRDRDKKGKLVIREVGLKKGGTQKEADDDRSYANYYQFWKSTL